MTHSLREYQLDALNKLRANIKRGVKSQVLMLATGGGKTVVASYMKQGAAAKGKRAYFIVDSLELVDQAAHRFIEDGLNVGVIQGNHPLTDYAAPIQVATIQTLRHRWPELSEHLKPDFLVVDECHVLHRSHIEIINECKAKNIPVIGLSATPFRKGMADVFDELVIGATTSSLQDAGFLVPATCYGPTTPDLSKVKLKSNGDYDETSLAETMGTQQLTGDIVENWLKLAENRQTIVFACNVAHSRALAAAFQGCGIEADHIDGYTDTEDRNLIINNFRAGKTKVLCNCAVLTKGFDAPETSCIVLARPTKSLMLHIQMIGRGLRIAPQKHDCIVIDHAGNCHQNGLPDDPLPQKLDDGKAGNPDRKKREPAEKVARACSSCGFLSTSHACPRCGFKPESRQDVEVVDGELFEIRSGEKKQGPTPEEIAARFQELKGYARMKGYNEGWAFHKCQDYYGKAPRNTKQLTAKTPSEETLRIIKHLNIKAAKRKAA